MKVTSFLFGLAVLTVLWILIPTALVFLNGMLGLPIYVFGMFRMVGIFLVIAGAVIALIASLTFMKFGKGTPAITEPPKKLVIKGLYRRTRNPIYIAHVLIYLGLFLFFGHVLLFVLFITGFIGLYLYIIIIEEPILKKRFGEDYLNYMRSVPRWL